MSAASPLDRTFDTVAVRDGEALDTHALLHWLQASVPTLVPAQATLNVRQFPAGFSNLTYLVSVLDGTAEQRYVLRRPPHGVRTGMAHDMTREHGILAALHPRGVPVPRPVACCTDHTVLGAPFYLMEHVSGTILRGTPPAALTADAAALPERMRTISRTLVETLVQLHAVPVGDEPLRSLGRPDGYVERQVAGWSKRWLASRTQDIPALDAVAAWLETQRPPDAGAVLVHNDFKLDNLVLDSGRFMVRAILDWEMATIGDPLMDLGTSLAYWVEAGDAPIFRSLGLGITALPGAMTRADVVQAYAVASGRDVRNASYYLVFGLFKVAVIAQQIFARYQHGATTDARFARLGAVVEALAERASAEIARARW